MAIEALVPAYLVPAYLVAALVTAVIAWTLSKRSGVLEIRSPAVLRAAISSGRGAPVHA